MKLTRRRCALTVLLTLAALATAGIAQPVPPHPLTARAMADSLPEVKNSVLAATGYRSGLVELTAGTYLLTVTLVNSTLAMAAARDTEAHKIASAVTRAIATRAEYKSVLVLHIDYVSRSAGADGLRIVDEIDFWKDAQGNFRLHTT